MKRKLHFCHRQCEPTFFCDDGGSKLNLEQTKTTMAMAIAMLNSMADVKCDGNVKRYGNMGEDN